MGLLMAMAVLVAEGCRSPERPPDWATAFSLPAAAMGSIHPGLAGAIIGVHGDMLFIGGGANFPDGPPWRGGKKQYQQTLYVYADREGNKIAPATAVQLPFSQAYGANCNTDKGLIVAGGENEAGLLSSVLLISWDIEKATPTIGRLPDLPFAVTNATLTATGGTLYLAGGERQDAVSNELLTLDLTAPDQGWKIHGKLPYAVSHACLVAQHDGVYLIGGRKRNPGGVSDFYDGVWCYDIALGTWAERAPLPKPLSAAAALAYPPQDILLISGDDGRTFRQVEGAIAAIAQEADAQRRIRLEEQKIDLLENHPGFDRSVWRYHTGTNTWHRAGQIPVPAPVTTTATLWQGDIYLPSGEINAGVRSPHVLVGSTQPTSKQADE